ncbi:MAG: Yip1 family protein [Bacteroidota bacterium]
MNLVERVKNIIVSPKTEWDIIQKEETTPANLLLSYVAILALIPAIAGIIGQSVIGITLFGTSFHLPITWSIIGAVVQYILAFVGVYILAFVADALAPSFGGQKNLNQAMKGVVFSYTPMWIAGIFGIIPILGWLAILGLYGFYLLYLGLPKLMNVPQEKAIGYVVVVIIVAIIVYFIFGAIVGAIMVAGYPVHDLQYFR